MKDISRLTVALIATVTFLVCEAASGAEAGGAKSTAGHPAGATGGIPGPGVRTALYVLAPGPKSAYFTNILATEAALRAAAVELAAGGADVVYVPMDQLGTLQGSAYPRLTLEWQRAPKEPLWNARLYRSATDFTELGQFTFEWGSWQDLVSSAGKASNRLVALVSGTIKTSPKHSSDLGEEERKALDNAYGLVCGSGPIEALPAAGIIDKVLSAHPSSAEALRAAVWPSAILATQDLRGCLQLRDRYLAVPLGWWLAAEDASPAGDTRAKLTEAWLALLCGFPKETLLIVGKLDKDGQAQPMAEALTMFATRDYRPLDGDRAADAPAIKQLAWIWALQECYLLEPRNKTVFDIMTSRKSAAFGPIYNVQGVGTGHMFTEIMADASTYDVLTTIVEMEAIPADARQSLKSEMKASHGAEGPGDELLWTGMRVMRGVKLLNRGAALALSSPDGPVRYDNTTVVWQSLSPWAYAQVQRGLAYQAIHLRGYFLSRMWGVPERATAFLRDAASGFEDDSGAAFFFQIIAGAAEKRVPGEYYENIFGTEMGSQPAQWALLARWESLSYLDMARKHESVDITHHPCGAWEAQMCLNGSVISKVEPDKKAWYECMAANDRYNTIRSFARLYEGAGPKEVSAIADEMPYSFYVTWRLAKEATDADQNDVAVSLYKMSIASEPSYIAGYDALAELYEKLGDRAQAIGILKEGCSKTEFTVASGNVMSKLAALLLKDGETNEALVWAERGSETGSGLGLRTYGLALIRAGKSDEGLRYYKMDAERYASEGPGYISQMFTLKVPNDTVGEEAMRLAKMHGDSRATENIIGTLGAHGQFDAAVSIMESNVGIPEKGKKERYYAIFDLLDGKVADSARHFHSAIDLKYLVDNKDVDAPYVAEQAYIAACLAPDEELKKEALEFFSTYETDWPEVNPMTAYFRHKLTREQALEQAEPFGRTTFNLLWIFGVECETSGDMAKAIEYYKLASANAQANRVFGGYFVRQRLKALGVPFVDVQSTDAQSADMESTDAELANVQSTDSAQ